MNFRDKRGVSQHLYSTSLCVYFTVEFMARDNLIERDWEQLQLILNADSKIAHLFRPPCWGGYGFDFAEASGSSWCGWFTWRARMSTPTSGWIGLADCPTYSDHGTVQRRCDVAQVCDGFGEHSLVLELLVKMLQRCWLWHQQGCRLSGLNADYCWLVHALDWLRAQ